MAVGSFGPILIEALRTSSDVETAALFSGMTPEDARRLFQADFFAALEAEADAFARRGTFESALSLHFWMDRPLPADLRRLPMEYRKAGIEGKPTKPYQPRFPLEGHTPRLAERDWWPLRNRVLHEDGFTCNYCGDAANCVDHIIPLSRGGTNDRENLQAACMPCNSSKSDKLLSEWRGRR